MNVLFIGGTGTISEAVSRIAVERGINLTVMNRGTRPVDIPAEVTVLRCDVRDMAAAEALLTGRCFDVVVDWVAYNPEQIEMDLALFQGRTDQFIFISSASAYQKPPVHYKITESTPLANPHWGYSRNKIAAEERLMRAYREDGFPITIVRPSYTYGRTYVPWAVGCGWTIVDRIRKGKKLIVHGDGQSLWTMTHNTDFAKGIIGLFGNQQAIGEAFHITSDEVLTWDQIAQALCAGAGMTPSLIHIPSDFIAKYAPGIGAGLIGDKACSMVMDNGKIKRAVPDFVATTPFKVGVADAIAYHDADPARQVVNEELNDVLDRIIAAYEGVFLVEED
ncbi:MAG: UDP-glucose 4-epimerase [bacterium ADurb.Bin429]|nr:MAG: UDP-glucose 4-epimerase [bacterium ADurb.Bin429]